MRLLMWGSLALALTAGAAWLGHSPVLRAALEQLHAAAQSRLDVIAARLDGELARFDYLPSLLETTPEVFELLAAPDDTGLRQRVSHHLRGITATAGADNHYLTHRCAGGGGVRRQAARPQVWPGWVIPLCRRQHSRHPRRRAW
jgi:two-component system C4-dicarboxylate transport sensor histidine kinase DctB